MKVLSFARWFGSLLAAALLVPGSASAEEVRVMISSGFYGAYAELGPAFERTSGHRLSTTRGPSMGDSPEAIPTRLARGETADVVILDGGAADELVKRGLVRASSKVELARSQIGMVVRAGAAKPDIGSVDAFRRTLLAAKSIGYSDSASGVFLSTTLFARLGVADQIAGKSRKVRGPPSGEPVAAVVARGDVEVGFQQVSELLHVAGVTFVGTIPAELQPGFSFAGAITTAAGQPDAALALLRFLTSSEAAATIVKAGLTPPAAAQGDPPAEQPALTGLTIVAPAAPGGGWDQLAREMQREIERQALAAVVQVENVPGAAGTIGLAQLINGKRGDGGALLVNGLVMLGAILWNRSPVSLSQVTPIARLTGEYEVVAVPATSSHRDMQSLVRALRENPAAVSWGGGSAGGTDHILAGLIVAAAGVDPRRTNYIAFSGGGEAATALIGGQVTAGIGGYSEFAQHIESGRLRAVGISAPRRTADLDVPSLIEQGLDVELENWRAVVAAPGLNDAQRQALTGVVERMAHSESWRTMLARLGWTDSYLAGPAFDQFLEGERVRVGRIVARLRGSAEDATAARAGEWLFPVLVLGGSALVLAVLFVRRRATTRDRRADNAAVVRVALGLVSFVALLNVAGFVAAGTLLFACTASAFGSRRRLRDALLGIILCATVYAAFTYGLDVSLPPGLFLRGR